MLTVEEALDQILKRVRRLETERVDLFAALGRALAETVVSSRVSVSRVRPSTCREVVEPDQSSTIDETQAQDTRHQVP